MTPDDSGRLNELVMQTARRLRHRWRQVLAPWELTPSAARALRVICDGTTIRISDVAEHLRIAPRSATEVADDLEARGLISREQDPRDRRVVLLRATDEGHRVWAEVGAAHAADLRQVFGRLSAGDRTTLARILEELRDPADPAAPRTGRG